MCALPDTDGSDGFGQASGEDGASKLIAERKRKFKELIVKANSVSLLNIFKAYGVSIDECSRRCSCPFRIKHKGGRDNTPSFNFYPETNTFYCFGCKTGVSPTDFVSILDGISKYEAATKILSSFISSSDFNIEKNENDINYQDRYAIIIDFSNFIRFYYSKNKENKDASIFIDKVCQAFDKLMSKHNMNNDSIKILVSKLKDKVENHFKCHVF